MPCRATFSLSGEKIRSTPNWPTPPPAGSLGETFDGDRSDLFALQDQITSRIANHRAGNRSGGCRESEARKTDPRRATCCSARCPDYQAPDFGKLATTRKLFRELLVLEPTASMPWRAWQPAGEPKTIIVQVLGHKSPRKNQRGLRMPQSQELDPANAFTYEALGYHFIYRRDLFSGDFRVPERHCTQPQPFTFLQWPGLASLISGSRRNDRYAEQALSLDPHGPQMRFRLFLGVGHLLSGHDDPGDRVVRKRARKLEEPEHAFHLAVATPRKATCVKQGDYGGTASHRAKMQLSNGGFYTRSHHNPRPTKNCGQRSTCQRPKRRVCRSKLGSLSGDVRSGNRLGSRLARKVWTQALKKSLKATIRNANSPRPQHRRRLGTPTQASSN